MVVVVFLGWFRDRLQKSLDRTFYREKYRLDKAVRQLGAAVDRLKQNGPAGVRIAATGRDGLVDVATAAREARDRISQGRRAAGVFGPYAEGRRAGKKSVQTQLSLPF
jgi:hypothetical protein